MVKTILKGKKLILNKNEVVKTILAVKNDFEE